MPYTKDQARTEIAKLVTAFKASEARLQAEAEAQIENNYIRPLFRYLNWNTENSGLAVADYEFVVQRTDRYGKRPDYILQLDGQHLLVMDAKQVKHDMHDPRWMNQVYAYAYSTQNLPPSRKIDFAVLTDFQEFVVLDCTLYAGDPKVVGNFRVLDWSCDDYVTQFETLWELFERENLREAAATRAAASPSGLWARYLSPKKVKANRIPPDKSFLAEMDDDKSGWRVRLAKDMKKRNPGADGALITAAVQLLIDRLIFVKALSDREIEDDYLAQLAEAVERDGLAESDAGWFTACRAIFDRLNQFYNGSIFERRPELEAVTVSNKVVREVLRALQPENSPYNFAVLPVEILGTIYERFLGRVVRTTEKQVKIEDKPEVRKAGGVYYTPQYIVDTIVQNTVGKLLEDCHTPEDVARLKIADPACGSGSFLLGAYSALIDWHARYYGDKERLTRKDRAAVYYDSDGSARLTAQLKRQILLNNLFGVDIDAQAVEVTRFSLSLKALEDTRHDELYEERDLFKQTVLPDLRHNIKHGNSLIGPDYFANQMFADKDELLRVNPFDWEREFPHVFGGGGFDAVIGNPPYIRIGNIDESLRPYLYNKYEVNHRFDIYVVFIQRAFQLLSESGLLGFIVPNKFFTADYGENLRRYVVEHKALSRIVDFGDNQVFQGATTYTCLLFLNRQAHESFKYETANVNQAVVPSAAVAVTTDRLGSAPWAFLDSQAASIHDRLNKWKALGQYCDIARGLETGLDDIFLLTATDETTSSDTLIVTSGVESNPFPIERSMVSKVTKGAVDIRRYLIEDNHRYLLFPYYHEEGKAKLIAETDLRRRFPLAWKYLQTHARALKARGKDEWFAFRRRNYDLRSGITRLLIPSISKRLSVACDGNGEYHFVGSGGGGGGGYGLTLNPDVQFSALYLLGLLNCTLLDWAAKLVNSRFGSGYYSFNRQYIEPLPIREIDFTDPADRARHDKMVALVESMLALHKHKAAAKTQAEQDLYQRQIEATDRAIDGLVYELYGLTAEEVAVVEGRG